MTGEQAGQFVVQADRDGELTLEHWAPNGFRAADPWCWWETRIGNGTSLPQMEQLAASHLTEAHRTVIDLGESDVVESPPGHLRRGDLADIAVLTGGLRNRELLVDLDTEQRQPR
ncbi:hypothetical protein AB0K35_28145 [Micromonospora sp. NPDC053740]|uniref:hypothetical protein n=1 Tax=Micromonospora sp. NPDC053740 TaxID=3155173 RepID=UPI003420A07C